MRSDPHRCWHVLTPLCVQTVKTSKDYMKAVMWAWIRRGCWSPAVSRRVSVGVSCRFSPDWNKRGARGLRHSSTLVVSCRRCWSSSPITIKTLPPEINRQREARGLSTVCSHTHSQTAANIQSSSVTPGESNRLHLLCYCNHIQCLRDLYSYFCCNTFQLVTFHFSTFIWTSDSHC